MNKIKKLLKKVNIIKIAILTALLGAYGGQGKKKYRRIYVPLILMLLALLHLKHWSVIFIMAMIGAFSMGYGIPSPDDNDPSSIGRFWYNLFNHNELWANVFTRGTIAWMVNISLISIPILKGNWLTYSIGCLFIKLAYTTCSWRDLGVIKIGDKHLLIPDLITYGIVGLMAGVIIYF